jgi:hypothetical protein
MDFLLVFLWKNRWISVLVAPPPCPCLYQKNKRNQRLALLFSVFYVRDYSVCFLF